MSNNYPDLEDFQLFLKLHKVLKKNRGRPMKQNELADEELEIPQSSLSKTLAELEVKYPGLLHKSREGVRLTPKADEFAEMCEKVLGMVLAGKADPTPTEKKTTTEIRIVTTTSLRARLFPGPVSAYMMWLSSRGRARDVRVTVDAINHDDLLGKVRERGYYAYHFGVCWDLPQNDGSKYVEFEDLRFKSTTAKTKKNGFLNNYGVPIVALTSLTDDGIQPDNVKKLFRSNPQMISAEEFTSLYDDARVAVIKTEPEDDLRKLLMQGLRESSVVRVEQYEDVLHHVRSMDCDIGWGAAWFGYRKHILARLLSVRGEPWLRHVKILTRTAEDKANKQTQHPLKDADDLVRAFYIIFKLFYSEATFYRTMFGLEQGDTDPSHVQSQRAVRNWISEKSVMAEIESRLNKGTGEE